LLKSQLLGNKADCCEVDVRDELITRRSVKQPFKLVVKQEVLATSERAKQAKVIYSRRNHAMFVNAIINSV